MAHLLRAQPDTTWVRGYITLGTDLKNIDQNTFVALNGDAGGTWTPAGVLTIGGAGVVVAGPWQASGALVAVAAPTFNKGTADDYFGLAGTHPGVAWTLVQGLVDCYSSQPEWVKFLTGDVNFIQGLATFSPGVRFLTPLRVFHGATLESVTLNFYVQTNHGSLPTQLAQLRIIAIDAQGNVLPLGTATDNIGFTPISAATTGAGWYSGGTRQSFVYACSQNNVIDLSKYSYFAEIIDESGANCYTAITGAGNIFVSVSSLFDTISIFDGRA